MSWRAALSRNLREVRVIFCAESKSSEGVRNFLIKNYNDFKTLNPGLPFLLRDGPNAAPSLNVRYDFGKEQSVPLDDLNESQIEQHLKELVLKGDSMPRSKYESADMGEDEVKSTFPRPDTDADRKYEAEFTRNYESWKEEFWNAKDKEALMKDVADVNIQELNRAR
eukprot:TRINITY_DN14980_c0_g1_i1.p1 TRINITY_DN14980_c0_g1~~TRINITY_DN14980_c0_g1_i1.p1  ORF type:complete len:167 (-),score=50.63 TRINITY_DN14980_c0_g1_i1:91-591(-)